MGVWDSYFDRMDKTAALSKRDMWIRHTQAAIKWRMMDSPSLRLVKIDGVDQHVSITHTTDLNKKTICAMPGERLKHGGIVDFKGGKWMIIDIDFDDEVYQRGKMVHCNHLLKWINKNGELKEKWCYVEDGTKYLTGEYSERMIARGDARYAVMIPKDADTIELDRGMRFIVDDSDVHNPVVYEITKPHRLYSDYSDKGVYEGVFKYIFTEVQLQPEDNVELGIANYYDWMPGRKVPADHEDSDITIAEIVQAAKDKTENNPPQDDKEVWL